MKRPALIFAGLTLLAVSFLFFTVVYAVRWSGKRVSNPQPSAWEADALPVELLPQQEWGKPRESLASIISTSSTRGKIMNLPSIKGTAWLNSRPLTDSDLKGKVVLVDFWDYTCVNCIRTLPYIKEWHRRYKDYGLLIIGVHSPEFPFAKEIENVERAVKSFELSYPIVLDNNFAIWRSFGNSYWPAKYIFDANRRLRYYHFGEGEYQETERTIQALLKEITPSLNLLPTVEPIKDTDVPGAVCYPVTPELYLGYERGRIGNQEGWTPVRSFNFHADRAIIDHIFYLDGWFTVLAYGVRYVGGKEKPYGRLFLNYQGYEVNLVMHPPEDAPSDLKVEEGSSAIAGEKRTLGLVEVYQDGKALTPEIMGEHIKLINGFSVVEVGVPQMYNLVKNPDVRLHSLELRFLTPGTEAYAFTFTSCALPPN